MPARFHEPDRPDRNIGEPRSPGHAADFGASLGGWIADALFVARRFVRKVPVYQCTIMISD